MDGVVIMMEPVVVGDGRDSIVDSRIRGLGVVPAAIADSISLSPCSKIAVFFRSAFRSFHSD